jgi:hypothetical protein
VIERQQCCEIVQDGVKESEINETHVTAQGEREAEEDGNMNMNVMATIKGIWEFLSGRRIRKNSQEEARDWWVSNKPDKLARKKNLEGLQGGGQGNPQD